MTTPPDVDARLGRTVNEIRDLAHRLGARRVVASMPTLDGEADVDYRPDDWLRITIRDASGPRTFVLAPDWNA